MQSRFTHVLIYVLNYNRTYAKPQGQGNNCFQLVRLDLLNDWLKGVFNQEIGPLGRHFFHKGLSSQNRITQERRISSAFYIRLLPEGSVELEPPPSRTSSELTNSSG
jgi:hypothetical protein